MANQPRVALAVVSAFSLFPLVAHAGSGGSPTAPTAGKGTEYCCVKWEPVREGTLTILTGKGCVAIIEDPVDRNACLHTVAKCRGELFTPSAATDSGTGKVERCLTP